MEAPNTLNLRTSGRGRRAEAKSSLQFFSKDDAYRLRAGGALWLFLNPGIERPQVSRRKREVYRGGIRPGAPSFFCTYYCIIHEFSVHEIRADGKVRFPIRL